MPERFLFGPVTRQFAEQNLRAKRQAGQCLCFGYDPHLDISLRPGDSWPALQERLPPGWQPDFLVLYLAYTSIPAGLWTAPLPIIGLAPDWNLLWHYYRRVAPRCDLVFTDTLGVEKLHTAGIEQARIANLYGCGHDLLDLPKEDGHRDIDILFVGNLHTAVQRERMPWLGRIAKLADRWNVHIVTGLQGADYHALLRRTRIVFNRSIRGECNLRALEAAAAGALLFQEAGNLEVPSLLQEGKQCIFYGEQNLESLLEHYLTQEEERHALAESGRARVRGYGFGAFWAQALTQIEADWQALENRSHGRIVPEPSDELLTRTWQALGSPQGLDATLTTELATATTVNPVTSGLHNALGVMQGFPGSGKSMAQLVDRFQAALRPDENYAMAALNLAEAFAEAGQAGAAVEVARILLGRLEQCTNDALAHAVHYPPGFDLFRVEWERVAWANAGDLAAEAQAKRMLLRWRLHSLAAILTGDLADYEAAATARPDLPATQAALGCALARVGRVAEAVSSLQRAVADNPFDLPAARALCQALRDSGDHEGGHRVVADCRLLARAAPAIMPVQSWFAPPRPTGNELTSVVILCHNEVEYTRHCLESLLRNTQPPFELILIDNASTDDTLTLLQEIGSRPGPVRVEIIHNEQNRGFAAGCNQGIAAAQGEFLVFLNNDTVVTPEWLEGLMGRMTADWPRVGLVGPVSNYTAAPQLVPAGYDNLAGLDAFAEKRRQSFRGKALAHPRLTGFCLLARSDVLAQVGGFDEQFGLGLFEDDDLCVRVRRAGFKLAVALDTYIHHFGSRTFTTAGVDYQEILRANFGKFAAKWGPGEVAPYQANETLRPGNLVSTEAPISPMPTDPASNLSRPRVSLTMIVKNEEANLGACLASVADLVDEIVIVDTGSSDRTKEVAARFGAKIFDFVWCNSFSAARNESLRHATGAWAFWLDADDRLDEDNRQKLRTLFAQLGQDNAAYAMKCLCLPEGPGRAGTVVDHVRLFRNRPEVRWTFRVHEQILPAIRQAQAEVRWADVVIQHTGYRDPALRGRKLERDLHLLRLEHAEQPDHPFTLFNLGSVHQELGHNGEALVLLRRSLELSHPQDSIVRKLYALIATCHQHLGQIAEALKACQEGRIHYADDTELLFRESLLRREAGDRPGAVACLQQLLQHRPGAHFASVDADLRGLKARQNLAVIFLEEGRLPDAEKEYRIIITERPDSLAGWVGLGEIFIKTARWVELDQAIQRCEGLPGGAVEAELLRAKGLLTRKDYSSARIIMAKVIADHPQDLMPRVILSHILLQEGRDLDAAEKILRDILARAPHHAESQHNLRVLLMQRQQQLSDSIFSGNVSLAHRYLEACQRFSDIHEHLPTLYSLAQQCRHVTEMGTRTGVSTTAFLYAQPEKLVCYDRQKFPQISQLQALAEKTEFTFHEKDVLWVDIEETDLLFIDTWHVYGQLKQELERHAGKARKYIVLHDTTTFGEKGETEGHRGVWPAVEEFLAQGIFRLKERFHNNNGLTVLERKPDFETK